MGGQQPISGATIQLYAVGTTGDGSAATKLLTSTVASGSNGTFGLTGHYTCPVSNPYVYLLATGGNASFGANSSIALIVALGQCSTLSAGTYIVANEVTTAAAVIALAPYMSAPASIGSGGSDAGALANAFALAGEFANFATGTVPGTGVPSGFTVPTSLINTLADIIASCVNTGRSHEQRMRRSLCRRRARYRLCAIGCRICSAGYHEQSNEQHHNDLQPVGTHSAISTDTDDCACELCRGADSGNAGADGCGFVA